MGGHVCPPIIPPLQEHGHRKDVLKYRHPVIVASNVTADTSVGPLLCSLPPNNQVISLLNIPTVSAGSKVILWSHIHGHLVHPQSGVRQSYCVVWKRLWGLYKDHPTKTKLHR